MTCQWTVEEIGRRLGLSTVAFPEDVCFGAREIARIREAGITRVEICGFYPRSHYDYRNRAQVSEIISECRKQGVTIVSVHGPWVPYDSEYEEVRKAAVKEAVVAAKVAEEMEATIFVGHFYTGEHAEKTVCEMLDQLDGSPIKLVTENGQDLRDYVKFVEKINSEQLGIAVDIGHTIDPDGVNPFIKEAVARRTMAQCGKWLFHVHLHDFKEVDHWPPLDGKIQWSEIFGAFKDIGYEGELMFEANRGTPEEVLQKTAAFPEKFVQRCGCELRQANS